MIQLSKKQEEHVSELRQKIPLVNAADTTTIVNNTGFSKPVDAARYVEKLKKGGINIVHFNFISWPFDNFYRAAKNIYRFYKVLEKCKDDLLLVDSYEDVRKVAGEGKVGAIMHFHSPTVIEDDLGFLSILHRLGLRAMELAWQGRSLVGDGCGEKPETSCGLSSFGYKFVKEMNRLHILIDLAHSSRKTFMDAVEFSKDPVIYSHGCVQALCDEPRGRHLSDEQIRALAEKGGVLGIMAKQLTPAVIGPKGEINEMTMDDYMRHLEYVVQLVGVDYVGIGTENGEGRVIEEIEALDREIEARFYEPAWAPISDKALYDAAKKGRISPSDKLKRYAAKGTESILMLKTNLLRELVGRGYSDQEIAKILSGNFFRIYKELW